MLCRSAAEILFLPIPEYLQKAKIADYRSKGSVKNNLAFLHPDFTISLTDLQSQKSSK
jgi:hypothetical protein